MPSCPWCQVVQGPDEDDDGDKDDNDNDEDTVDDEIGSEHDGDIEDDDAIFWELSLYDLLGTPPLHHPLSN